MARAIPKWRGPPAQGDFNLESKFGLVTKWLAKLQKQLSGGS
jgi:hypothetical protein